ncbi:hypothetical protein ACFV8Z_48320 [Streptomyces sp. NPDC059837]|uniref:hypothetical protein n=1 Tax=Streptomyces sp. NPDC059837 TaxID=3346968 RepID=UPI0036611996
MEEATTATGQTAEGVKSCRAILDLSRVHGAEMPITEVVAAVIDGTTSVSDAAAALMSRTRPPRSCPGRRSPSSTAPDRHPCRSRICTRLERAATTGPQPSQSGDHSPGRLPLPGSQVHDRLSESTGGGSSDADHIAERSCRSRTGGRARCPGRGGNRCSSGDVRPAHHGRLQGQLAASARGNGEVQGRHSPTAPTPAAPARTTGASSTGTGRSQSA